MLLNETKLVFTDTHNRNKLVELFLLLSVKFKVMSEKNVL